MWLFSDCGSNIETKTEIELISFNDIKINNFSLPGDFLNWKIKERKKYVLNNHRKFAHNLTSNQYNLINTINDYRHKKGIDKLIVDNNKIIYLIDLQN